MPQQKGSKAKSLLSQNTSLIYAMIGMNLQKFVLLFSSQELGIPITTRDGKHPKDLERKRPQGSIEVIEKTQ